MEGNQEIFCRYDPNDKVISGWTSFEGFSFLVCCDGHPDLGGQQVCLSIIFDKCRVGTEGARGGAG